MADSFARGESSHPGMPEPLRSSQFPEIASTTTQVVLVMDGPKEFTIKPFKGALENISASGGIKARCLSRGIEELAVAKVQGDEWKSYSKYVKLQAMIDLCKKIGVVTQKEVVTNKVSLEIGSGRKTYKPSCNMGGESSRNMAMIDENGEPVITRTQPPTSRGITGRFSNLSTMISNNM
ncbi:hypothetical protein NC653_008742 [Populus alba x Populus x berolinensis]|uniref:Uncharacterized protein n=1 Tax=Populus alba x Populus x berolinensis TaxID=444605 RepID=A0AAD6R7I4_9ROSI|nr:hypothetical protein NC653_008742 [Populus alba x Populus x berolinensis]